MTGGPAALPVTVVIPTRDRGVAVCRAVRSALEAGPGEVAVRVVDQSDDDATRRAVAAAWPDPPVAYVRTATRGLSAALNVGVAGVAGGVVVLTADDCELRPGWLPALRQALAEHPGAGVVFGEVAAGPHDAGAGFVPGYVQGPPCLVGRVADKHRIGGTSSCMAFLRPVWEACRGFDEALGKGARFRAGEDVDFTLAALRRGWAVYATPRLAVTHHGFYPWAARDRLVRGYWYGTGAAMLKHLKTGCWPILPLLARLAGGWLAGRSRMNVGTRPARRDTGVAFLGGLLAGALTPVDRATGHYAPGCRRPGAG